MRPFPAVFCTLFPYAAINLKIFRIALNSKTGTFPSLMVVLLIIYNSKSLPINSSMTTNCLKVKGEVSCVLLLTTKSPWRVPELTAILVMMINLQSVLPASDTKVLLSIKLCPEVEEMMM